jgi:hypothetical protein
MNIDRRKIKVSSFSSELEQTLNRELRTFLTIETEIYEVATQDQQDGTFNEIYKAKLVGSTVIKQVGQKEAFICKSKRSPSQRLRAAIWQVNEDDVYYEVLMNKIITNIEEVAEFLKNK